MPGTDAIYGAGLVMLDYFNKLGRTYKYFYIRFNSVRGRFGCVIINVEYGISIDTSEKWFDEADFDKYLSDLQEQLALRIPDKFLEHYGWK